MEEGARWNTCRKGATKLATSLVKPQLNITFIAITKRLLIEQESNTRLLESDLVSADLARSSRPSPEVLAAASGRGTALPSLRSSARWCMRNDVTDSSRVRGAHSTPTLSSSPPAR